MGDHECPSCGAGFDTRRGLGVHHSHVHDERLSNRECEYCGTRFYSDYEKKYCSRQCLVESDSFAVENNPNYGGGKETTECDICGRTFEYYPSEKEGFYCPDCVESEEWREVPAIEGSDNPRWNGGTVELTCPVCEDTFERYPNAVKEEVNLCSEDCRAAWLSEAFAGEGHPNWDGGGNDPYGKGWNEVRERALERDGYECVVCGKAKDEIGRNPDVHHIVPVRAFVESENHTKEDAHTLDNVASLCIDCHRKADFGRIPKAELRSLVG